MKHLLLICLLASLLAGCASPLPAGSSSSSTDNGQPGVITARMSRVDPGSGARTDDLVKGVNHFAFDLYRAVGKRGNLIYSPYSIGMAFSMVYAGARGRTEAQMAHVLGFLPQESQHPAANALDRHMSSLGAKAPAKGEENGEVMQQGEAFQLKTANAVWGQRNFPFEQAYLQTLAKHYGAGVRAVDFAANPEAARRTINAWVSDQTRGHIRDVVPPDVIDASTRLALANAIYFKAAWLYPFGEGDTKDGAFTLLDGRWVTVPMMHQLASIPYAEGDGYQAVVLPYTGDADMVVVAPKSGRFQAVESRLGPEFLEGVRQAAEEHQVALTMPRFKFENGLDLAHILPGMGMPDAFGPADFSGISKAGALFISAAVHRATIAVDEKGTEATAATVITAAGSARIAQPVNMTLDRPFIFAIVDRQTRAILFLGRVTNPAA